MFENDCLLDVIIKPSDMQYLRRTTHLSAVYVFFINREPMYVGESKKIYERLKSHYNGGTSATKDIIEEVDEIGLFFTRKLTYYEMAFITCYNPPLNKVRSKWRLSSCLLRELNIPDRCTKANCNVRAHLNGLCHRHGGNGILPEKYAEQRANEIIKNNIQLKLII